MSNKTWFYGGETAFKKVSVAGYGFVTGYEVAPIHSRKKERTASTLITQGLNKVAFIIN